MLKVRGVSRMDRGEGIITVMGAAMCPIYLPLLIFPRKRHPLES